MDPGQRVWKLLSPRLSSYLLVRELFCVGSVQAEDWLFWQQQGLFLWSFLTHLVTGHLGDLDGLIFILAQPKNPPIFFSNVGSWFKTQIQKQIFATCYTQMLSSKDVFLADNTSTPWSLHWQLTIYINKRRFTFQTSLKYLQINDE